MSWKCNLCDTYNEDAQESCSVCGQSRAEAVAFEAERAAEAERERRRMEEQRAREEAERRRREREEAASRERIRRERERAAERDRTRIPTPPPAPDTRVPIFDTGRRSPVDKVMEKLEKVCKIVAYGGAGVAAAVAMLMLALKVLGGELDDVFFSIGAVAERGWYNVARTALLNGETLLQQMEAGPLTNVSLSLQSLWAEAEASLWELNAAVETLAEAIFG